MELFKKKPRVTVLQHPRMHINLPDWRKLLTEFEVAADHFNAVARGGFGRHSLEMDHVFAYTAPKLAHYSFDTRDIAEEFLGAVEGITVMHSLNGSTAERLGFDINPKVKVPVYIRPAGMGILPNMGFHVLLGEDIRDHVMALTKKLSMLVANHEGQVTSGLWHSLRNPGETITSFKRQACADAFVTAAYAPIFNCRPWLAEASVNNKWVVKPEPE